VSALLEAIAVGVHLQDVYMVGKPIEQGAGEPLRSNHFCPSSLSSNSPQLSAFLKSSTLVRLCSSNLARINV
jgi:hypothetical protein